jgi:hypothetical protein
MTSQTEALKLALKAIESEGWCDTEIVITAIKEALAQPAQEPVAHLCGPNENGLFGLPTADKACKDCFPVYRQLPQRPWVGLMRGARVEGDTVVIKVQSNNEARLLCSELVNEMGKNT